MQQAQCSVGTLKHSFGVWFGRATIPFFVKIFGFMNTLSFSWQPFKSSSFLAVSKFNRKCGSPCDNVGKSQLILETYNGPTRNSKLS